MLLKRNNYWPPKFDNKWVFCYNRILDSKEKDLQMTTEFKSWDELSELEQAQADIIEFHRMQKSTWPVVYQNLRDLADSDYELFGEAMDTEVREVVYAKLGFTSDFYI